MLKVQIGREDKVPFEFGEEAAIFFGADLAAEEKFFGKVEVSGEIIKSGENFVARGKVSCPRSFVCDKCLVEASEEFSCEFEEVLTDEEVAESVADITELVRDIFLANLPMQNLCRADCKGLCPVCGKNLNEGDCECGRFVEDPRLAVLKNLKLD